MRFKKGVGMRFTKKQADRAAEIANDINEDIDNGEHREELRVAVAYWASVAVEEGVRRAALEGKLKTAKAILDI